MVKIAICDDNINYLTETMYQLVNQAAKKANIQMEITLFVDGTKLLNDFKNGKIYDIVILDIEMPKINGKELARQLRSIDTSFFLIFMSAYKSEVYDILQYNVNSFIFKGNDTLSIQNELIRVFKEYSKYRPEYEMIEILRNGARTIYKIPIGNIMAFYLFDKILYMRTYNDQMILQEKKFSNICEKYKDKGFYECCRNYLINVKRIQEIKEYSVVLDNGEEYPVSKRNKKGLISELSKIIMSEIGAL